MEKLSKELSVTGRKHVAKKNFVYPKEKRYPIHDLAHARNALARVSAHGTPGEQSTVRAKVYKKYPALKERSMEKKSSIEEIYNAAFIDEINKIAACKSHGKVAPKKSKRIK